ncbi:MAG: phage major capsid protein [Lachnospiraceae bacterium]
MARGRVSRKAARARGKKSVSMDMDDLKEMVSGAVKEALAEEEEKDDDDPDEEEKDDDLVGILEDAMDVVAEKRKSAKSDDVVPEDADELIDAIISAVDDAESKSEGDVDLVDAIEAAVESVNEKRKSKKTDGLPDDLVEDVIDAVAEMMSDDEAGGDSKRRKSRKGAAGRRLVKSSRRPVRTAPVQRKYGSFYMSRKGGSMETEKKTIPPAIQLARAIKCLDVWGKQDPEAAAYHARKKYDDADMAREFKALNTTSPSGGGFLIPEVYSDQIVELLYPKTVIVDLGAQNVPLTNGILNIPKMTAGSRARWGGEQRKINSSQPAFGNIRLSAKRLESIIPQSRELMMSTSFSADQMFANDLTRRMQLGLDYGGLYGRGGEFQPLGIAYNKDVENVDVVKLSDADLADASGKITADFPVYIRSRLLSKNVDDASAGWAMNSMLEGYLMNLKTTTGVYIYRDDMQAGKLLGFKYKVSNQIPTSTSDTTDMFFGNWSDLLIGDQMGLETYTTMDGAWTDDEGVLHNAFDENLAATRALMYDDIGVRHAESFLYCKNIKVV